jgi:hypothetical protein
VAKPHVVRSRLEGAYSLITQGKVMPELNRDGLASLLTEAINELNAYDSLRSQIEAEVARLRKLSKEAYDVASRLTSQGMTADSAHMRGDLLREEADRLQAILDFTGGERAGK